MIWVKTDLNTTIDQFYLWFMILTKSDLITPIDHHTSNTKGLLSNSLIFNNI